MVHQFRQNLGGGDVFSLGFKGGANAVAHDVHGHGPNVFRRHKSAMRQKRMGLGSNAESNACPRRRPKRNQVLEMSQSAILRVARGEDEVDDVVTLVSVNVVAVDEVTVNVEVVDDDVVTVDSVDELGVADVLL